MWGYEQTKKGYLLKYINEENKDSGISIQLPVKQKVDGWIMYWNKKRVQQLVNGLNNGTIPFYMGMDKETNELKFSIEGVPTEVK